MSKYGYRVQQMREVKNDLEAAKRRDAHGWAVCSSLSVKKMDLRGMEMRIMKYSDTTVS
jgi:hypothetical protein